MIPNNPMPTPLGLRPRTASLQGVMMAHAHSQTSDSRSELMDGSPAVHGITGLAGDTDAPRKRNTMVGGDPSLNPIPPRCRIDQPALFLRCQPLNRPRRLNRPRQTMRLKVRLNGPGSLFRTPRRFDGLRQKFPDFLFHSGHPKRFRMLGCAW